MRFAIFWFFEYRLECLLNKWDSEGWQDYLALAGCVIGWTRGTGLMSANNIVAPGVENLGIRTFSTDEMAINLIGLLTEYVENWKILKCSKLCHYTSCNYRQNYFYSFIPLLLLRM